MYGGFFATLGLLHLLSATPKLSSGYIIAIAVGVKLSLLGVAPMFEDDVFRYLWDGFLFFHEGTPYQHVPADFYGQDLPVRAHHVLNEVSYPNTATVYGPLLELFFVFHHWADQLLVTSLSESGLVNLSPVTHFRLWIILFECLTLCICAQLTNRRVLYLIAFNPLLILHFSINAHAEIIPACCFMFALLLAKKERSQSMAIFFALTCLGKLTAIFLIAPLLIRKPRCWPVFGALILAPYLYFIPLGASDLVTLSKLSEHWTFNSIAQIVYSFSGPVHYTNTVHTLKQIALVIFGLNLLLAFKTKGCYHSRCIERALLFFLFILCTQVVNLWYFLWVVLPFQPKDLGATQVKMTSWACILFIIGLLSNGTGLALPEANLQLYQVHPLLLKIEYGLWTLASIGYMIPKKCFQDRRKNVQENTAY